MSTQLPAKIERKRIWEVDAGGTAVEKKEPPKALTSGQRHYHYRLGLMAIDKCLKEHGFVSTSDSQSTLMYTLRDNIWIDISIKAPARIAYVTSRPGYEYSSERINAKVVTARDMLGCDRVIQIVVTSRQVTSSPILVPLPNDLEHPAKHVVTNVLGTLSILCDTIPGLREAFSKMDPNNVSVPDNLIDPSFLQQLE